MNEQVHVTLGHTTVMAEAQYFGLPDGSSQSPALALASTISRIGQLALNVSPHNQGLVRGHAVQVIVKDLLESDQDLGRKASESNSACRRPKPALTSARTMHTRRSCMAWRGDHAHLGMACIMGLSGRF